MESFNPKPYNPKLLWRAPGFSGHSYFVLQPSSTSSPIESPLKTMATLSGWTWGYIALWKVGKVAYSVKTEDWLIGWQYSQSHIRGHKGWFFQKLNDVLCSLPKFSCVAVWMRLLPTIWSNLPIESDWPLLNPECWTALKYMGTRYSMAAGILEAWQDCSVSDKCPRCIDKEGVGNVTCSRSVLSCGDYHPSDSINSGMLCSYHVPHHPAHSRTVFFLKVLLAFLNTFLTRASHTMGHLSQLWPRRLEGVAGLHRKVILLLSKIPAQNPDLGGWGKCLPSNHTILW